MKNSKRAFTLMELVIAVLIIGILAAVAVPMYKHAMIKSRFSTVMPVAKTIADAQESYYLRNGQYASEQAALDVTPPNVENTTVALSGAEEDADENYAYVVASRSDVPGARYIQYQKNSPQFAENIHCEALTGDEEPNWLCKALGGEYIGENGDYTAYLLSGDRTAGTFAKKCKGAQDSTEQTCECGGSITRDVSCDTRTGEWDYTDWSGSCPTKPATSQECSANSKTGTQTRSVTCTDGTWVTGNWSSCDIPCEGEQPANITASQSGATGTASCVDGEWVYTWTEGQTYTYSRCVADSAYACAGATFTGGYARCYGNKANACAGSIVKGWDSSCTATVTDGCKGAIILAGSYCSANTTGGCNGALYGAHPDKDPTIIGSCYDYSGDACPVGVPLMNVSDWNGSYYGISGWKGNCCNPAYMVSGVCPDGIAVCQ